MGTEPIVFNTDGTIDIMFDDATTVHLACPRLHDYRAFRNDINRRLTDILEQRKKVISGDASVDEQRDFLANHDVMVTAWVELVFETLATGDTPSVDDWPAWLANSTLPTRLMSHWQTAPFNSGN